MKAARFLEPGSPTGLTGLFTHASPRSALLYLYLTTLERLTVLPETSVYRRSTESLTRHRLKIVESIKPANYDAWLEHSQKDLAERPELFKSTSDGTKDGKQQPVAVVRGGSTFVAVEVNTPDPSTLEWDGEKDLGPVLEGTRSEEEKLKDLEVLFEEGEPATAKYVEWEPEPQLDADQLVALVDCLLVDLSTL